MLADAGRGCGPSLSPGGRAIRLIALAPPTLIYADSAALDLRVLSFTALLAIGTGLVFGILPAWQVSRTRPNEALRDTERVVASRWILRSRNALLVAEVALSLALLVGAGLMVRSLVALNRVDLGFEPSGVLAANISFPRAAYPTKASELAFFEAAVEHLRRCARHSAGRVCDRSADAGRVDQWL